MNLNHPADSTSPDGPARPDVLEQVQSLCREGRQEEAVSVIRAAILQTPDRPELIEYLSKLLGDQTNSDGQLAEVEKALRAAPDDASLHARRAGIFLARDELESAVQAANQAIQLDSTIVRAYEVRAMALGLLGRQEAAMADVHRRFLLTASASELAEHDDQKRLERYFARGHQALHAGEFADAIQAFSAILLERPDEVDSLHSRGHAYYQHGQYELACADLLKAWQLRDSEDRIARNYIVTAVCHGNERVLGIFPATPEGWKEADALATGVAENDATRAQFLRDVQKLSVTRIYFAAGTKITQKDYVWAREIKPRRRSQRDG